MSLERLRFVFLGLGAIVLTAGGVWMAAAATDLSDRAWGAFGALFFGLGIYVNFRAAFKGQSWPKQTGTAPRFQQLIVPIILIFTLPWSLKLWFCLPLLFAWGLLVPEYRDRLALRAVAIVAAVLAIAQALVFLLSIGATIEESHGAGEIALQSCFLLIVLWLDGRLLWEVRNRLRTTAPQT